MPESFRYCPCCAAPLERVARAGVERLACPRCGFVRWENPVPVVAAIVEHDGKVVLARNALWPPGMFALITGFMEKADDTPEAAVLREVKEELGLDGEIVGFVGHYRFQRMNQIILAYHVRASGAIRLDPELVEYRCVVPEALRPWGGATGDALRDWMLAHGWQPLPYDYEPLRCIAGYRPVTPRLAAGRRPQAVQFLALSLGKVQTVLALGQEDPEDRRAAEAVGLGYRVVPLAVQAAPDAAALAAVQDALDALREQRVYVCDPEGHAAVALSVAYAALVGRAPAADLRRALQVPVAPAAPWSVFVRQQLLLHGISL